MIKFHLGVESFDKKCLKKFQIKKLQIVSESPKHFKLEFFLI